MRVTMPHHYFSIHFKPYKRQPQLASMGQITNWFKANKPTNKQPITTLFAAASNGHCIVPSNYELATDNSFRFVSSSLILIDVDDDNQAINPYEVLHTLHGCCGLFYTFSHGKKGNRYRLVFQLDRAITEDAVLYKLVVECLIDDILKQLPILADAIDTKVKSPTAPARTGILEAVIKDVNRTIDAQHYIQLANKKKLEREEARKRRFDENSKVAYPFSELVRAAHAIGYIPSGIGDTRWASLVMSIKSYVEDGFITNEQGYELYAIISGDEASDKAWNGFKPHGNVSIGTFFHHAKENGFRFDRFTARTSSVDDLDKVSHLPIERHQFADYITADFVKGLLEQEEHILLKADTGSGKTRSTITAMKELGVEMEADNCSRFFILSVPTVAITQQVGKDFDVLSVRGALKNLYANVRQYVQNGNRVFVATYDMTKSLATMLQKMRPGSGIVLAVDEVHQLTSNYNYRRRAINELHTLIKDVRSFIGLTGTPDDVFRDFFDHEMHVTTHTKKTFKAPCKVFGAVTYQNAKDEEVKLLQLIQQKAEAGKKLLVFIQNKDVIKRLFENLKNRGIRAASVTSDYKAVNASYKCIVGESRFPDNVQVVLTTSVLSDGINILNERGEKYECILVASRNSQLFNVDQARQMANRFRNLYEQFVVYMQVPQHHRDDLFNIERAYRLELQHTKRSVEMLEAEYKDNGVLYVPGVVERRYELTSNEAGEFTYNALKIRHEVANEKAMYYSIYRAQFIKALERLLGIKSSGIVDIDEALKDTDLSDIEADLQRMREAEKMERNEKAANIANVYTPKVYAALQKGEANEVTDVEKALLQAFSSATISEHFSCLKNLVGIVDYDTSLQVVQKVTNQKNINNFKYRIEALAHISYYEAIARTNITKKVYTELLQHVGSTYTKEEQKQIVSSVAKKIRTAKQSDVQHILNTFFIRVPSRTNKEYFITLEQLTIKAVAEEYEVDSENIVVAIKKYAEKQSKIFKRVLNKKSDFSDLVLL